MPGGDETVVKKAGQLLHPGPAKLFGVHDRHRAPIIARDIMADANGDELHGRAVFDPFDNLPQMTLQIGAAVNGQGGIVDWRTVTDDHHYAAILGPADQAVMRPEERLAIDVFLEQPFAHHQAEIASRPTPGRSEEHTSELQSLMRISYAVY